MKIFKVWNDPRIYWKMASCDYIEELDLDMLIRIMQEPKNALIKQYEALFKMDGVNLEIKNDALKEIAKLAIEQKTGARGLRSILETLLNELMFKVPDYKDLEKIIINKEVVNQISEAIMIYNNKNSNQKFWLISLDFNKNNHLLNIYEFLFYTCTAT